MTFHHLLAREKSFLDFWLEFQFAKFIRIKWKFKLLTMSPFVLWFSNRFYPFTVDNLWNAKNFLMYFWSISSRYIEACFLWSANIIWFHIKSFHPHIVHWSHQKWAWCKRNRCNISSLNEQDQLHKPISQYHVSCIAESD